MVKPIAKISVVPSLPSAVARLRELAYNLRWSWDHDTIALFRRIDRELWDGTGHNPVRLLGLIDQDRLEQLAADQSFMAHYQRVCQDFDAYMAQKDTWFSGKYGHYEQPIIAYFSMEFGLTECFQNYSGGLGVLSGDHLKSSSDLGIPLVGVGLLYQEGYFRQYLNADGWQQENYPINDYANLPITREHLPDGTPLLIRVPLTTGRDLYASVWRVQVGRVPLLLLDTNVDENIRPEDRNLTDRLYGGDKRTRIRQELLMGIGGIRLLEALNLRPRVVHMNEGHSAFLSLERIRVFMQEHDVTFSQAQAILSPSSIFTTHTPVPAGLERFGFDLIDEHFADFWRALGLSREEFHNLGRENMGTYDLFSMPVLALKVSGSANGVAALHGVVSRHLWQWMYPGVPEEEVPVSSVTNGIHTQTWISNEMATLLDRYLSPRWRTDEWDADCWEGVQNIPDTELWRTHVRRRERLIAFTRERLVAQLKRRGAPQHEIREAQEALDPETLTVGFARRFATYKRATLIFRDLPRVIRMINDADRPVQFIFAGKAHPHDNEGKEFIRQIVAHARSAPLRHRVVFLEDYDMEIARYMVQGVDIWLNNPRRPKEASGTSGMKVVYNGGLNCSVLDGWWDEGYAADLGWAIGNGEEYPPEQEEYQDQVESQALYNVFETEIIPMFYTRGRDNLPREWVQMVKQSMMRLSPFFNTHRMLQQYTDQLYMPSLKVEESLTTPDLTKGMEFAAWRAGLVSAWAGVSIKHVDIPVEAIGVGEDIEITAQVVLGKLAPENVTVQVYYGTLTPNGDIGAGKAIPMTLAGQADGVYTFKAHISDRTSGERGVSVRILPSHPALMTHFLPGIIRWA